MITKSFVLMIVALIGAAALGISRENHGQRAICVGFFAFGYIILIADAVVLILILIGSA